MRDPLPVSGFCESIGEVGAPVAAPRAKGVEAALQMLGHVAPRIVFERICRRRGELDGYVGIFGERHHVVDRALDRPCLGDLERQIHVIDDERQLRVTFRDGLKPRRIPGSQKHDRQPRLLGRRPEPVRDPTLEQRALRAVQREPHAQHSWLLPPLRKKCGRFRLLQRNAAHDRETAGITLDCLQRIIVAVAWPRGRHDYRAIDARFVHQRHEPLDGERLGQLRHAAWDPAPVRRFRLP